MAPASCSPWPCCKRGVTSCLSLHLFFALPEGPPGTSRGCDGSTADPCSYGPPGPQPGSIPACAASAVRHCHGLRCSCRVPGSFLCPLRPPPPALPLEGAGTVTSARRHGCVTARPWTHSLTQLDMHRKSHTWPHICGQPFTQVFNSPGTHKHRHSGIELPCPGTSVTHGFTQTSFRDTASHEQIPICS